MSDGPVRQRCHGRRLRAGSTQAHPAACTAAAQTGQIKTRPQSVRQRADEPSGYPLSLIIDDDIFDEFLIENESAIENAWTLEVAKASEPEKHLTLSGGVVFSEDEIVRVLDLGNETVFTQLSHIVKTGALAGNGSIETLVLMNAYSGEPLVLEDGCLAGSSVSIIVCNSEQEAAYVKSRLAAAGAPDAEVVAMDVSQEGFVYFTDGDGWTTLLYDSWWVESFDGTLTGEDGGKIKVNEISDYAFAGDLDLKWVTLDESVVKIGKNAFRNRSNLQGLFIGMPGTIDVGANALAGCWSPRTACAR